MNLMRKVPAVLAPWLVAGLLLSLSKAATAEITELKMRHGKKFICMQSGLVGAWEECGTQDYVAVFRGKVTRVVEVSEWELELTVNVEEVFKGDSIATIKFGTSQGICFDNLNAGSEWLFFLEKDEKTGAPYLNYYSRNPSGPVAARIEELARMRKLKSLHGEGMIIGSVQRVSDNGRSIDSSPVSGYRVVARDPSTGKEYWATTDSKGKFAFDPLPSGSYSLTPSKLAMFPPGLQAGSSKETIDVAPGGCSQIDLAAEE
jgi:hypothetical protein